MLVDFIHIYIGLDDSIVERMFRDRKRQRLYK